MADRPLYSIVPLGGKNFPTWKTQMRMALIKESLWEIVSGTEVAPAETEVAKYNAYVMKKNRALATIVLGIDPSLLYLLGEPTDPKVVWDTLCSHFQKKTWANKLSLRRKLYNLRLKDGGSIQEHIKSMTEIFEELTIVGDKISEEDRVVHLLASLPEKYNVLVTALEANSQIPSMELVLERLSHEDAKMNEKSNSYARSDSENALTVKR